MKIVMIGAGYVGLVTGACFAEFGFEVVCVDKDQQKINALNKGEIPIYEPGLESLVQQCVQADRLSFTTNISTVVKDADIIMIAVGTPARESDGHADLRYVFDAIKELAPMLSPYTVIITKSTVPVGTGDQVAALIKDIRPEFEEGRDFDVASNPEFLREGSAIRDFMRPDRVVMGTDSPMARELLKRLYRPLSLIETPLIFTNRQTAEMIKYAANGFLAMKIAFINQMADICEKTGADVQELAKGIGLDNRIGKKFLNVGPGYGGSCFPKDTLALARTAKELDVPCTLIDAVIASNDQRKYKMSERILHKLAERGFIFDSQNKMNAKVAVLGITFKPNTDDLRDAPSLIIVPQLLQAGLDVVVYDPLYCSGSNRFSHLEAFGAAWGNDVTFAKNVKEAVSGVDAVIILTEWNEFRGIDLVAMKDMLRPCEGHLPLLIDYRNIYKANDVVGFQYVSLGKKDIIVTL